MLLLLFSFDSNQVKFCKIIARETGISRNFVSLNFCTNFVNLNCGKLIIRPHNDHCECVPSSSQSWTAFSAPPTPPHGHLDSPQVFLLGSSPSQCQFFFIAFPWMASIQGLADDAGHLSAQSVPTPSPHPLADVVCYGSILRFRW